MHNIVVIGSGLAGYMLAKEFRKLDTQTPLTMITENEGHFYSKPQLSTTLTQARHPISLSMGTAEAMEKQLNMRVITQTHVKKIDREHKFVICDDQKLPYSHLVLALGAEKIKPCVQGTAVDEIHSVNHLEEYRIFRTWLETKKSIAVIGSGLVGCEFANDLINTGYKVLVISKDTYPLSGIVPEKIGNTLRDVLASAGVDWYFGRTVCAVNRADNQVIMSLDKGDELYVDGVFSATGLRAHTQLAAEAGLEISRGIVVNRFLQTADPAVCALGDCAEVNGYLLQYIAPLLECARALAKTLAGEPTEVGYPVMPVIVKTPSCPIISVLPRSPEGSWEFSGEGIDIEAKFIDLEGNLSGFCLSGKAIAKRAQFVKQLPHLF